MSQYCSDLTSKESKHKFSIFLEHSEDEDAERNRNSLRLASKPKGSTRVSLLVEALIRGIIAAYESDSQKAAKTYRRICSRLFRMGLIDNSWSMSELESARAQFEQAFLQLLGIGPSQRPSFPPLWLESDSTSQYKREFEEIKYIGGGAFGKVFKVRHKLDGTEYAVKKIPIYAEGLSSIKTYLAEVKTFASMNHPNIVQYKAAWLEIEQQFEPHSQWNTTSAKAPTVSTDTPFIFNRNVSESFSGTLSNSQTNFEIEFEGSKETDHKSDSITERTKSLELSMAVVVQKEIKSSPNISWATLFIQMALCHGTLYQWIRRRTETINLDNAITLSGARNFRIKAVKEILVQILKGLSYIHSRGVVHHDIKPSNIFVTAEGGSLLVQLGDFGLACPLQQTRHRLDRGTPLYAAPEQLAGHCNPKSDMYSVGIVLFELLEDFGTDMERTRRITELRSRASLPMPSDFDLENLVDALVRRNPEERPDALTLLHALEDLPASELETLQERLSEKDREIQRLTELLLKNGIQV